MLTEELPFYFVVWIVFVICPLSAKLFGVTEFINPLDYKKPIQEVGWAAYNDFNFSFPLSLSILLLFVGAQSICKRIYVKAQFSFVLYSDKCFKLKLNSGNLSGYCRENWWRGGLQHRVHRECQGHDSSLRILPWCIYSAFPSLSSENIRSVLATMHVLIKWVCVCCSGLGCSRFSGCPSFKFQTQSLQPAPWIFWTKGHWKELSLETISPVPICQAL